MAQQKTTKNTQTTKKKVIIGISIGLALYTILTLLPFTGPYFQYPLHMVRCMRLPIIASDYTDKYYVPGKINFRVTPVTNHFFCSEEEAVKAYFTKSTENY